MEGGRLATLLPCWMACLCLAADAADNTTLSDREWAELADASKPLPSCGNTFKIRLDGVAERDGTRKTGKIWTSIDDWLLDNRTLRNEDVLTMSLQLKPLLQFLEESGTERFAGACKGEGKAKVCFYTDLYLRLPVKDNLYVVTKQFTCAEAVDRLFRRLTVAVAGGFASNKTWNRLRTHCTGTLEQLYREDTTTFAGFYRCAQFPDRDDRFEGWGVLGLYYYAAYALASFTALLICLMAHMAHSVLLSYLEVLDLSHLPTHLADAVSACKIHERVVLAWAGRWDLPERVWDEYWEACKELRRCPVTALSAFDFWGWRELLSEAPVDIRPAGGPLHFNLALLIPYSKLVSAGLGASIEWRKERDKDYGTLYAMNSSRLLPEDDGPIGILPTPAASPCRPTVLRKPRPGSRIPLADDTDQDATETFDNRDEEPIIGLLRRPKRRPAKFPAATDFEERQRKFPATADFEECRSRFPATQTTDLEEEALERRNEDTTATRPTQTTSNLGGGGNQKSIQLPRSAFSPPLHAPQPHSALLTPPPPPISFPAPPRHSTQRKVMPAKKRSPLSSIFSILPSY